LSVRTLAAPKLIELVAAIMRGGGCDAHEATMVSRRLVDSNLVGHDSHGIIRVGKYLEWMRKGWVRPNQSPTIVFESDTIAIIDGNRGFGQVVGEFAGKTGTAKASKSGIAMVGLRNCGHLGRVGDWAELAAAEGQVSLHFLNTSGAQRVAPFGGSDRRLSTNPITVGVPVVGGDPVILDVTTSMVAEGKLFVASNKGEKVPPGWIIDKHGKPTIDPKDFYDGGALLTVGGHKGSGLSIIADLLAGAISTGRSSDPGDTVLRNNMLSIYIAPAVYDSGGAVAREVARFVAWVKASPASVPGQPVLLPGEVERATRARRSADGIAIDDQTWKDLAAAAVSVGISAESATAMVGA
jgi:hydroxycarboxylate dehydrogenase B